MHSFLPGGRIHARASFRNEHGSHAMMPAMSGDDIRAERLKKIELINDAGMSVYPAESRHTETVAQFVAEFEGRPEAFPATLAGRVMSKRGQGGISFADIYDGSQDKHGALGRVQVVFQKDNMDERTYALFMDTVDIGDFLEVTGTRYVTKRGEKSLLATTWRMLAKSLSPIPSEWYGVKDQELTLRQRYLDILMSADTRAMFVRRAAFWNAARTFLRERGFLEVETPVLESSPGGADARPFITHHNSLDIDVYLRISAGELWQKRLLVAGFPKVFEIGRIFRNEGQSREHLQDYTQLECYEAYSDMQKGKDFVRELYRFLVKETYGKYTFEIGVHTVDFANEWPEIDFCALIQNEFGVDPLTCTDAEAIQKARDEKVLTESDTNRARAIDSLWKKLRKGIAGPAFLTGIPVYLEPLAKRSAHNPLVVDRLQVILAGSEMGKGFSELNDPLDQRARFEEQQKMRDEGDDEAQRLDEEYIQAMEYGMPPAFGFGVSERLFSFLENRPAHEAQLFPLLRPRQN